MARTDGDKVELMKVKRACSLLLQLKNSGFESLVKFPELSFKKGSGATHDSSRKQIIV